MLRRRLSATHGWSMLGLATARSVAAASSLPNLPYNPTRIFRDESSKYAYVVQPDTDSDGQARLLSLDISQSLEASSLPHTTLYPTLPFLDSDSQQAILPVIDSNGNITVIAGNCSNEDEQQIWTFTPESNRKSGNGTWTQRALSSQEAGQGVNYLSSGISFSELVSRNSSNTNLYLFGGMCPFTSSTSATWTTAANYTNQMVEYSAEQRKSGNVSYTTDLVAMRGPPVVEAGFTITPLTPTYSANVSNTPQTQQQSFILIGGHTRGAFINMSSVAVFSLPQQGWTFEPIEQSSTVVEPRSGHTAVLTEDGNSIVIFGGWVGDISTPASPQLAVLDLASNYGGEGDWAWSVPSTGSANISGSGLYGHGALMLPGGVMMVSGGYSIPTASIGSRLFRRATSATSSSQTLFYNVSSQSWLSTYDPPASVASMTASPDNQRKGSLSTASQKAGLGAGLTIGVLLVIGLVLYYFWYMRRMRKREGHRSDKEGLVQRSTTYGDSWLDGPSVDGRGGAMSAGGLWGGSEKPRTVSGGYAWLPQDPNNDQPMLQTNREVERSGLSVSNPSPTRGLRKGTPSRAQYQYHAAPRYDDGRLSRSSGHIHPIEERDEEEDRLSAMNGERPMTPAERQLKALATLLNEERTAEDPFKDPPPNPLRSHPVSPEIGPPVGSTVRRSGTTATDATNSSNMTSGSDQVSGWIGEWTASYAAAMRATSDNPHSDSSGRLSPTKTDERTGSNLSDESDRSGISGGGRSIARTSSTRSGLFFGLSGTPSFTPKRSPVDDCFTVIPNNGRSRSPLRAQYHPDTESSSPTHLHSARPDINRTTTADTFATASTTWGQLIEQSEALLGSTAPQTTIAPLNYPKRRVSEKQHTTADLLANAGPAPPIPPRRRLGWMGSIRRALGTYDRSFSSAAPLNPHHISQPLPTQHYYDRSATSSPTKSQRTNGIQSRQSRAGASSSMSNGPRRTASDGSEFLRSKRGRQDWERDSEASDPRWVPYRDEPPSPDLGDWGEGMAPEIIVHRHSVSPNGSNHPIARSGTTASSRPRDSTLEPIRSLDEPDDWDVETAAAKRDVQVMFTVPKARLRVVNADPDRASQRSVSEGGVSVRSNPVNRSPELDRSNSFEDAHIAPTQTTPAAIAAGVERGFGFQGEGRPRVRSRGKSEASSSLESFTTAQQAVAGGSDRGSAETLRKTSNYGVEIVDWEREALEKMDREEKIAKSRKNNRAV